MCKANQTEVDGFFLLGFQYLHEFRILLFIVFFVCFLVIINGNVIIIFLVTVIDHLKIPMFFFLKHLAIADVMITLTVVPLMLDVILNDGITISVTTCVIQLFCCAIFGFLQCPLIAVMSYDRYLAICNPMRYNSLMKPSKCQQMVVGSWTLVFIVSGEIISVCQLHFCGGNTIDHFFCDFSSLMELSTSDVSVLALVDLFVSTLILFVPFALIIVTYLLISFTIFNISSATGRQKAFSTCSSHLATVCTYYGSLMAVYLIPLEKRSSNVNKFMTIFNFVATPMVNPIIYSLRNREIRRSLLKLFSNSKAL